MEDRADAMPRRIASLDLLKAYGILMMVQGHTLDAILNSTAKATGIYHFLTYLRGFTAPVFLFAAGIGFMISLSRRKDDAPLKNLLIRLRHLIPIIAFGYFLHLPFFSLYKLLFRTTRTEIAQ
ncbi:MAG: heparan-alpha-glucosaminide N-acetyltransferase domain-containing protein, partial [candidate division WOR-3 bacterium]